MTTEIFLNTPQKLNAFCSTLTKTGSLEKAAEDTEEGFFKAEDWNGNIHGDFNTQKGAEDWLNEKFSEECEDDGLCVNETRTATAFVIEEDEDCNEIARHEVDLSYTNERSDYDEHNTMYTGGCI